MGTSLPSLLPEIVCGIVCRPDCWRAWRLCMVFARGCARGFLFVVSALCGLLAWNRPACRPPAAKGPLCLRYLRDLRILRDASSLKTEATEWIRAAMPKCQAVPPSSSAVWPGLISLDRTGLDWTGSCWAGSSSSVVLPVFGDPVRDRPAFRHRACGGFSARPIPDGGDYTDMSEIMQALYSFCSLYGQGATCSQDFRAVSRQKGVSGRMKRHWTERLSASSFPFCTCQKFFPDP